MRLPEGKHKLAIGCYYTMDPGKRLSINMLLVIHWYAWPFLMWKEAHKEYVFKWYQYPKLLGVIAKRTVLAMVGK